MSNSESLIQHLTHARRIVIFTGAGVSTASGIPDYRGPQGVWKTRQPVMYQDFMSDPEKRLEYWVQKAEDWERFSSAQPTPVHEAIAALDQAGKLACCITQNIDGLHAAAGTSSDHLVEIHGTALEGEGQTCQRREPPAPYYEAVSANAHVPECSCGGFFKPATISFGQSLKEEELQRAQQALFGTDLVIALGTTLSVQPAASFPLMAARQGVPYIILNDGPTEHDGMPFVTERFEGDVQELFAPAVEAALMMEG